MNIKIIKNIISIFIFLSVFIVNNTHAEDTVSTEGSEPSAEVTPQSNEESASAVEDSDVVEIAPVAENTQTEEKLDVSEIVSEPTLVLQRAVTGSQIEWIHIETPPVNDNEVTLQGKAKKKDWQILYNKKYLIPVDPVSGQFEFQVPIVLDEADVEISAISALGEVELESLKIIIHRPKKVGALNAKEQFLEDERVQAEKEAADRAALEQQERSQALRNLLKLGVSITSINFQQSDALDKYTMIVPSAKLGIAFFVSELYDFSANGFITTFPIVKTPTNQTSLNFVGVNARVGRHYIIGNGWRFVLSGGLYYLTTLGRQDLGYENVVGPQLYPAISKAFRNGSKASLYVKYSPVSSSFSQYSLSNHERAAGLEYVFPSANSGYFSRHALSVNFDYAYLNLLTGDLLAKNQVLSLGVSVGL